MAIAIAASIFICMSCDKDEDVVNPNPVEIALSSITISLDIEKGSLPEEYVGEISKVTVKQYAGEDVFSDIPTLMEMCVVAPMQEKLDEIAEASGCYDFSVTLSAYDVKDSTKIVYTKTLKPTKS